MDVRVLKYFLAVAREQNITRASEALHVSQPTLSRQLMELEEEVGAKLIDRERGKARLTEAGILFAQRAQEAVSLLDKTRRELEEMQELMGGTITIGCGETTAAPLLADALIAFSGEHARVRYELYSADGDDVREKLDRGDIDVGILLQPVESAKYDFIRLLPVYERWGIIAPADAPIAQRESVAVEDILPLPLIVSRRRIVQDEIAAWLGVERERLHIAASHNLLTNTIQLVRRGFGCIVSCEGALALRPVEGLRFIPFSPERRTGHVLAWKKGRVFPTAVSCFLQFMRAHYPAETFEN